MIEEPKPCLCREEAAAMCDCGMFGCTEWPNCLTEEQADALVKDIIEND